MSTQHLTDEQLSAHLDHALTAEERAAASSHLASCADCAARIDLLRATSQAVRTLPAEEMPRPLDLGFLHQGAAMAPPEVSRRGFVARVIHGRPPAWLPTAVAAAAVLVLAVVITPRLLPTTGGGASQTSAGLGDKATVSGAQGGFAAPAAPNSSPSDSGAASQSLKSSGELPNAHVATKTVAGPDGSTITLAVNPRSAASGRPTHVVLTLGAAPAGTSLAPDGMQVLVSQGANQVRVAASSGAGQQVGSGQQLDLTAEWSAGAVSGPPAPGSYILIGRVFLAGGRVVEVTLPFSVGPG